MTTRFVGVPENLIKLHRGEEDLRKRSEQLVFADQKLSLHLKMTECAMDFG